MNTDDVVKIRGFAKNPKKNANKGIYRGRLTCPSVQWTGSPPDAFATFTITAEEIADAAESRLLWTDQDVQRGVIPGVSPSPSRELCLCDGYPDPSKYVFDVAKADLIVEKLLAGEKSFLNPLVWNLRPGQFEGFWDKKEESIYLYQGKIYLPDSHHRHQAILKAVRTWREAPREYPRFSGDREFKVELYFLTREDEGNYFYEKNQLPKPTSKSKAFDLTTRDDLSLLAKMVIEKSSALQNNVNRVTDRLTATNAQVMTLSTLREMMKQLVPDGAVDSTELEGTAIVAASFYDLLATVRPELGHLPVSERRQVRDRLIVDAAVMMHGYAALIPQFQSEMGSMGRARATERWRSLLGRLASTREYRFAKWSGEFFDKRNPLWLEVGLVKRAASAKEALTVINTGAARTAAGRVLRKLVAADPVPKDVSSLAVH